jgi:hypothetical protein
MNENSEINDQHLLRDEIKTLIEQNNVNDKVKTLLLRVDIKGNINPKDNLLYHHGESVLHWAAVSNNKDICEYILEDPAAIDNLAPWGCVDVSNYRGTTPLHYAALNNSLEAVICLLKHNANPRIRSGFSALFPFEVTSNKEIKELLIQADNERIPLTGYDTQSYLVKKNFNHYNSYRYRLYMSWLSNLNYYICGDRNIVSGVILIPEAKILYQEHGIVALSKRCRELQNDYIERIKMHQKGVRQMKACLFCDNEENTKRCSRCKKVYFCHKECQSKTFQLHKYDCHKQFHDVNYVK